MSCSEAPPAADEVVDSVMSASRVCVDIAARSIASTDHDISLSQYRTLVLLVSRGPQRGRDLAGLLGVNPSSATRVVARLHRAGLVRRVAVKGDRRTHQVAPTKAGRDMVAQVTERRRKEVERLLGEVPAEFHGALVKGLHALVEAAGEPDEQRLREGLAEPAPELRPSVSAGTWMAVLAVLAALLATAACADVNQDAIEQGQCPAPVAAPAVQHHHHHHRPPVTNWAPGDWDQPLAPQAVTG